MLFDPVQLFGKMIVVSGDDIVDDRGKNDALFDGPSPLDHVHQPDTGHRRSAVQNGQTFPHLHLHGLDAFLFEHLTGRPPFPVIANLAFPDEHQAQVS